MADSMLDIARRADAFFMGQSPIHQAMRRLAKTLGEMQIPFAIAGGMTATHRPRDLDDVIQLLRVNKLPEACAEQLNPYVAEKYHELWHAAQVEVEY
ncbi:MAG: hypothetical protein AAF589_02005 [Planctomycetota bacterium]